MSLTDCVVQARTPVVVLRDGCLVPVAPGATVTGLDLERRVNASLLNSGALLPVSDAAAAPPPPAQTSIDDETSETTAPEADATPTPDAPEATPETPKPARRRGTPTAQKETS